MPVRVQMSRQHRWRTDYPTAVIVARPTEWGNPFQVVPVHARGPFDITREGHFLGQTTSLNGARKGAVDRYRAALLAGDPWLPSLEHIRAALAGKDLACWCPLFDEHGHPVPCHATVLLELANGGTL